MSDHISAADYRRQFIDPVLKEEEDDKEFMDKLKGIEKKGMIPAVMHLNADNRLHVAGAFQGKKPRNNEEDELTKQVTEYLEVLKLTGKVIIFSHIPASTFTKSWSVKSKNTAMGVRAGVPDMLIVFPDKVLFLELKRLKGGVVSSYQKEWIESLNKTGKVIAKVAAGFNKAKEVIDSCI